MPTKPASPFTPTGHVRPADFVGRSEQRQQLRELLAKTLESGFQFAFLSGPSGSGKSSFLTYVESRAGERLNVLAIRIEGAEVEIGTLCELAVERALKGLPGPWAKLRRAGRVALDHVEGIGAGGWIELKIHRKSMAATGEAFATSLSKIWRECRRYVGAPRAIAFLFDDSNELARSPGFGAFFKGLIDPKMGVAAETPVLFLFAGAPDIFEHATSGYDSVVRYFEEIDIEPMTREEVVEFVTKLLKRVGVRIDERVAGAVFEETGGFPYLVQLVGDRAYRADDDQNLDTADLDVGLDEAIRIIQRKQIRLSLRSVGGSRDQKAVLAALSKLGSCMELSVEMLMQDKSVSDKMATRFLDRLVQFGLLDASRGESLVTYQFTSPLYRRALLQTSLQGAVPLEARLTSGFPEL